MKTVLLWFFVSYGTGSGSQVVSYSPPFLAAEECIRVQAIIDAKKNAPGKCIQMSVAVVKEEK